MRYWSPIKLIGLKINSGFAKESVIISWRGVNWACPTFRGKRVRDRDDDEENCRPIDRDRSSGSACSCKLQLCNCIVTDVTWNNDRGGGSSRVGNGAVFSCSLHACQYGSVVDASSCQNRVTRCCSRQQPWRVSLPVRRYPRDRHSREWKYEKRVRDSCEFLTCADDVLSSGVTATWIRSPSYANYINSS